MGRLMRDKYRIGFIDIGGWDTHVGEGAAAAPLASNLGSLGRDYPVLNDYRSVLGGLFRTLWGLSPERSSRIFAQSSLVDLKLV